MGKEQSAAWWEPFLDFAERLFQQVVEPAFQEGMQGLHWEINLEGVLDDADFQDFGIAGDIAFYLDVYEIGAELVGGADDGTGGLYSGVQLDVLAIYQALGASSDPVHEHGITLDTLVCLKENPCVTVSGLFESKPVYLRLHMEPLPPSGDVPTMLTNQEGHIWYKGPKDS